MKCSTLCAYFDLIMIVDSDGIKSSKISYYVDHFFFKFTSVTTPFPDYGGSYP